MKSRPSTGASKHIFIDSRKVLPPGLSGVIHQPLLGQHNHATRIDQVFDRLHPPGRQWLESSPQLGTSLGHGFVSRRFQ
jgi:hypothetical protein